MVREHYDSEGYDSCDGDQNEYSTASCVSSAKVRQRKAAMNVKEKKLAHAVANKKWKANSKSAQAKKHAAFDLLLSFR